MFIVGNHNEIMHAYNGSNPDIIGINRPALSPQIGENVGKLLSDLRRDGKNVCCHGDNLCIQCAQFLLPRLAYRQLDAGQ